MKKIVFVALGVGFLLLGLLAYIQSKPQAKNDRIYKILKSYSPYYMEKRIGGLQIRDKTDPEFKEKPNNMEVFHRLDTLEKKWGKQHLLLKGKTLLVRDNNGTTLKSILLQNEDEINFVHQFYGL